MNSCELAKNARKNALRMVHAAKAAHIGSALSCADIIAVLYEEVMDIDPKNPFKKDRDIFLLSKGHAASVLYAILAEKGFFDKSLLDDYCKDGAALSGHVAFFHNGERISGVECSSGSLGHCLPIGCGFAMAMPKNKVYVMVGDGELHEGSIWESIIFAAEKKINNIVLIIDNNRLRGLGGTDFLAPLGKKFEAFNWDVIETDGHNHDDLLNAFKSTGENPTAIIANTIKGKGVDFMEGKIEWHYKTPNDDELCAALGQI